MAVRRDHHKRGPFCQQFHGISGLPSPVLYTTYQAIPILCGVKNCTAPRPARSAGFQNCRRYICRFLHYHFSLFI